MKRQRGRNRGGGSSGGGGKPQAQNANRAFDSNGPEGSKVRGNAQHVFEKYQQLARDASAAGDRVLGENYLQHAEHYFRLLRAMQPMRPASEILGRDHFSSGFDIDFEDESAQAQSEAADLASAEAGETPETWQARDRENNQQQQRADQARDDRPRDSQPRDGQGRDGQSRDAQSRDDRPRDDRPRDDRPRYENRDNQNNPNNQNRDQAQNRDGQGRRDRWRDDRPRDDSQQPAQARDDRPRDDRPPRDRNRDDRPRYNRDDRAERDPMAVIEPQAAPLVNAEERVSSPVLRDSDGGESHAPAFLQAPTPRAEPGDGVAAKPRRRRAPRADSPTPGEPEDA